MPQLPRILHVEVHKVLRLPRILHVKKQVNTLITMEERTGDHRRQPQTTQHPQPLTEHGGSQSAAPATNSARQETSEYSSHNAGTDRRPPTQHPEPLTEHGGSQSAAPATNSAHGGSQSAAPATNSAHGGSQSPAPATKSARQETSEYSNHNGGTDRRPPQTTADNPTARASNGAWRFTKCCACQEFCTWRFTKRCACHDFCTWRFTKCCACHEFCTSRNR